ncbi:MAG TPA: hypothetical protein VGV89_06935 [Thermoplasmata archaeon]|nr:hypothetical protein [Thermoplasmata archaeon]
MSTPVTPPVRFVAGLPRPSETLTQLLFGVVRSVGNPPARCRAVGIALPRLLSTA